MLIAFVCLVRYHHILSCYIWEKPWVFSGVHGNFFDEKIPPVMHAYNQSVYQSWGFLKKLIFPNVRCFRFTQLLVGGYCGSF